MITPPCVHAYLTNMLRIFDQYQIHSNLFLQLPQLAAIQLKAWDDTMQLMDSACYSPLVQAVKSSRNGR